MPARNGSGSDWSYATSALKMLNVSMPPIPALPGEIAGADGLLARRWRVDDAEALSAAIAESIDHLRPWMPWIADEPAALDHRRALILDWERQWQAGGDLALGVFLNGAVIGGCGLHRRI